MDIPIIQSYGRVFCSSLRVLSRLALDLLSDTRAQGAMSACMHFLLHSQMGQPSRPEAQLNMTVVKSSPNSIISRGRSEYSDTKGGDWQACSSGSLPTTPPPAGSSGSWQCPGAWPDRQRTRQLPLLSLQGSIFTPRLWEAVIPGGSPFSIRTKKACPNLRV